MWVRRGRPALTCRPATSLSPGVQLTDPRPSPPASWPDACQCDDLDGAQPDNLAYAAADLAWCDRNEETIHGAGLIAHHRWLCLLRDEADGDGRCRVTG